MKTNRRKFISTAVTGSMAAAVPFSAYSQKSSSVPEKVIENYEKLDKILQQPVLKKNYSRRR